MQFSAYRQVDLILDFGEVSTDRQVLSRVTRKVLSNSKHDDSAVSVPSVAV